MFVHIRRGDIRLYVPQKAFISKYAPTGFVIDNGDVHTDAQMSFDGFDEVTPNTGMTMPSMSTEDVYEPKTDIHNRHDEMAELDEIPLSEMTFPQLQRYAQLHGISANGYSNKKALREAIKEIMNK